MNSLKKNSPKIILASQSASRKQQLTDLGFVFNVVASNINEDIYKNPKNNMANVCQQIAKAKVETVCKKFSSDTLILGGDQIVVLGSKIFNKPYNTNNAIKSLTKLEGKTHKILTALYMCYKNQSFSYVEVSTMHMRVLTQAQITKYVELAKPINCAGSYALENYGIALFTKIDTKDYTAIIGFPLLTLINQLIQWNVSVPILD